MWSKKKRLSCIYWHSREWTEFRIVFTILCTDSFRWKDLKKARQLIFWKKKPSACCFVSRHGVSVGQISSSNLESPGSTKHSQVWTWKEKSTNSSCSAQRVSVIRQLRMVQTILEVCLSETQVSGNREHVQKIFLPKQCCFQIQKQ